MSRARKYLVGATLAILVGGTLVACASERPITLNAVTVAKAGEALEAMDATFRAELDEVKGDIAVSVSDESRCYFQVAKNDAMSDASVCGPVWRLGDDAPMWTTVALEISGDGLLGMHTSGSTVELEKDKSLYRPDGRNFDKGLKLEEPPAPNSAKPGEVVEVESAEHVEKYHDLAEWQLAEIVADDPSAVLTPDFLFSVNEARRAARVGGHDDRTATQEGHEFALVNLSVATWRDTAAHPDLLPEVALIADDKATPIDLVSYADLLKFDETEVNGVEFAMSIPDSTKELTLDISFDGMTQTIDLAERKRTSATAASYYDGLALFAAENEGVSKRTDPKGEGWQEQWHLNTLRAERTPYLDGEWATDGQTFIALSVKANNSFAWWKGAGIYSDHYTKTALAPAFTLTTDDGKVFKPITAAAQNDLIATGFTAVFTVPAGISSFDLGGEVKLDMVRHHSHLVPSSPAKASVAFGVPAYSFSFAR